MLLCKNEEKLRFTIQSLILQDGFKNVIPGFLNDKKMFACFLFIVLITAGSFRRRYVTSDVTDGVASE